MLSVCFHNKKIDISDNLQKIGIQKTLYSDRQVLANSVNPDQTARPV